MKLQSYTQYLYVPATQPERISKAFAAGADEVIVDWEDAVAIDLKEQARQNLLHYDSSTDAKPVWLRINAADTDEHALDLTVAQQLSHLKGIFLAKTNSAEEIEHVYQLLNLPIIAVIETASAMLNIATIAKAKGIHALTFGRLDLANELGLAPYSHAAEIVFDQLRSQLLIHSVSNQLCPPIDTVYPNFKDDEGLAVCVKHWRDFGMSGMMCIHPRQISVIQQMLKPSSDDIDFARRIVSEYEKSQAAAFQVDGKMIDMPVIKWAKHVLSQA